MLENVDLSMLLSKRMKFFNNLIRSRIQLINLMENPENEVEVISTVQTRVIHHGIETWNELSWGI